MRAGKYPKSVLENTPFLVRFFHLLKPIFKNRFIFFWNVGSIVGWTHISRIFGSTLGFRDIEVLKKVAFTINAILRIGQIRRYSTNVHWFRLHQKKSAVQLFTTVCLLFEWHRLLKKKCLFWILPRFVTRYLKRDETDSTWLDRAKRGKIQKKHFFLHKCCYWNKRLALDY